MSQALFNNLGGLRFWSQGEIMARQHAQERIVHEVQKALSRTNPAWQFFQCETPTLTPHNFIQDEYIGSHDLFEIAEQKQGLYLRPETTAGSYAYMDYLLNKPKVRLPLCVWQSGKSFRREKNDGASAAKLRFNEFWQLEFQCCYAEQTKADYREPILAHLQILLANLSACKTRIVDSDRLPKYSSSTMDIEAFDFEQQRWIELSSISTRTDNKHGPVLEIAIGLDRLISI